MRAIHRRELKFYFCPVTGYVLIAFMTMFTGIYFTIYNMTNSYPYFSYTLDSILMIPMIAVPILTMRSVSDGHRARTDQLPLTSPMSVWDIVMGKFLSMVTILAVPAAIARLCPFIIRGAGTAYLTEDYASILALFLLGCMYIAIGLFISPLTKSQFITAVRTFGILLFSILWSGLLDFIPVVASGSLVGFLVLWILVCFILHRLTGHTPLPLGPEAAGAAILTGTFFVEQNIFERALTGLLGKIVLADVFDGITSSHTLDVNSPVYYLNVVGILLLLTVQSIRRRRWS